MATNLSELRKTNVATKNDFPALLDKFKGEIVRALPKHLNGDRMSRIALTSFRRNPALGNCDPRSVFAAVIQASQLGLEPDMLGRSYLIPYGKECTFIPGWRGLVELVQRAGMATVWTGAVFQGDSFEYLLGDSPFVKHQPCGEDDPTLLTHVYAVGRVKGAEWPIIEVWTLARVLRHRDRYNKVGKRHYSYGNVEMYARKVVLLQVLKYMPMSAELSTAIALNDAAEIGSQHLTVNDAIDGTWTPVSDEPEPTSEQIDTTTGEILPQAEDEPDRYLDLKLALSECKSQSDITRLVHDLTKEQKQDGVLVGLVRTREAELKNQ